MQHLQYVGADYPALYRVFKNDSQALSHFKHLLTITSLFVLLAPEPGVGVGDLDGQLSGPLHDQLPFLGGHVVGDLSAVCPMEVKRKSFRLRRTSPHFTYFNLAANLHSMNKIRISATV